MTDQASTIERGGTNWSFRYDLSHLPEYALLQLQGYPLPARVQELVTVARSPQARLTAPDGRSYPVIVDMRGEARISMDTLKPAWTASLALRCSWWNRPMGE